jgi:uncharacterized repeat protein (TIGR01451 family)
MRRTPLLILVSLTLILLAGFATFQQSQAQTTEGLCLPIVRQALQTVGNNCSSFDRNSACYGYDDVLASFVETVSTGAFSRPNDFAQLAAFERIETQPFDEVRDTWGIAIMNLQANLPDTFPGQNVVFMLLGDSEMENAVAPEEAFVSSVLVPITTQTGTDLFAQPSIESSLMAFVPPGVTLEADAISPDGQWVRVTFRELPGWLMRSALSMPDDPALPVFDPRTSRTPMQAFYFRTGLGQLECQQAPDTLVVQGPRGIAVDITANGADIQLGSTILLRTLPYDTETHNELFSDYQGSEEVAGFMQLTVLDGRAIINPYGDEEDQIIVEEGYTTATCLSDARDLGIDGEINDRRVLFGCDWTPPRQVEASELAPYTELEGFVLNYPIELPDLTPRRTFTLPVFPSNTPRPTVTVQPTEAPSQPTAEPTTAPVDPPTSTPTDIICPPASVFTVADGDIDGLIAAIEAANREDCFPGADTITLAANGSYGGIPAAHNTTSGENAFPVITSSITINGNDSQIWRDNALSGIVTAAASPPFRLFYVANGGSLTLNRVKLVGGEIAGNGGAVLNEGTLTLNDSGILRSSANEGAAIYNTGTLTLNNSSLTTYPTGGATTSNSSNLYNAGSLVAVNSTLTYSSSTSGSNLYNAGTASLSFVTLFVMDLSSTNLLNTGSATLKNSLIASTSSSSLSCSGSAITSVSGNLSTDATCSGIPASSSLLLDPIPTANNSVTTLSHALLATSSAIDAASDCTTLAGTSISTDQRGAARPIGAACDSGAYESEAAPVEAVDIQLDKSVGGMGVYLPGDFITYTIVVTNNGPATATGLVVQDVLPIGILHYTNTATQGTYNSATGLWEVGSLDSGDSATLTINGSISATEPNLDITNTARLFAVDQTDIAPANNESSATITISPPPTDLMIGITANNLTPFPGSTVTFEVTVAGNLVAPAYNVVVTSLLPPGLTFVSATPDQGTYDSATGIWTVGNLGLDSILTLDLVAMVDASVTPGTEFTVTAELTSLDQPDIDPSNDQDSVTILIAALIEADIEVVKLVDNSAPIQGSEVVFTIRVSNNGPDDASGLTITDVLPAGLVLVDSIADWGTYDEATGIWTIGDLDGDTFAELTITAAVIGAVGEPITNVAAVNSLDQTDPDSANDTDSITIIPVQPATDIYISKFVNNDTPLPGATIEYTIEAGNGSSTDATNVVVIDMLPAGLTFVDADATQGTYDSGTGVWTVGNIDSDTSELLTITATVNMGVTPGTGITNTAYLSSVDQPDEVAENNQDTRGITVAAPPPDIAISHVVDNATPLPGTVVTYTITAANTTATPATNVAVTNLLPPSLIFINATPSQGTYDNVTGIWTIGAIPGSGSATLQIGAQVNATPGTVINNTATLTFVTETDSNPANNQATASVTVGTPPADIEVSKIVDNATPEVNTFVVFTITVTNNGPGTATNLFISDSLPAGLVYINSMTSVGSYDPFTGLWFIGTQAPFTSQTLLLTAQVTGTPGVPINNQASVNSVNEPDPTIGNNSSTATVTPVSACPPIPDPITSTDELITAIVRANDETCNPGPNTLNMTPGTYNVTAFHNDAFGLNGLPGIDSTITINGNGAVIQRVSATPFRFITVFNAGNLTLNNLTLIGGEETSLANGGGAVHVNNGSAATLNNVTLSNNRALWGGAISTAGGSITLNASTLTGNQAVNGGGGVDVTVGTLRIFNSTISGNTSLFGGAVHAQDGTANLNFVTIWNNTATGGVSSAFSSTGVSAFNVRSSIIGGNGDNICFGATINDLGSNVAESACGTIFVPAQPLNIQPLGNNGGPTQTHAFDADSTASNAVEPCTDADNNVVATDQRGVGRNPSSCDAGSFELP